MPRNTLWGWCQGKSFPTLDNLLNISFRLNISLTDLIIRNVEFTTQGRSRERIFEDEGLKRSSPRKFDPKKAETILLKILNGSNNSIPTIKEIAQRLKCSRRTLSRHFPDLCSRIVDKRRAIEKTNHNRKIEKCCQEVRQTTISLYKQGQYPHEANVSKLISHPGFFRYKQVRNTLKEVKRELGLEP